MSAYRTACSTCLVVACLATVGCSKQEPIAGKPAEVAPQIGQVKPPDGGPSVAPKGPEAKGPTEPRETAESFTSAFEKDYPAAVKKYAGSTVELTGEFVELHPNSWAGEPEMVIRLRGCADATDVGYARLNCKITNKQFESDPQVRSLSRGQNVTLRGKAQDNRDASVTSCTVLKVGPSTALPATLREIEEEVGKNPDTFGRFKGRDVVVRVTLGEPRFTPSVATFLVAPPKGAKKAFTFEARRMGEEYDKELTALKSGQEVLFIARVTKPFAPSPSTIELSGARLLKSLPEGVDLPGASK